MIETALSPTLPATVVHRVTGVIDQAEAAKGAAEALRVVQGRFADHGPLRLLLDLRGMTFASLQAHKVWSQGFARSPDLAGLVHHVAIVGTDTPTLRAEQELLTTDRVHFFVDRADAEEWLAFAAASGATA
ncbi:hypothetical protein K2Z83_02850 [Oscillochloris sp. ZM17-4]|uniref:STAS/SEC14 domain-containing protein n=1 Tax=Oscillochloris sp. ZM17-4 TaxID=2866714 RepID=UPI001C72C2B7|nr:STAS/SEC14 domain-containing protein [Oscillochloris sp. ZM17-4]MBX0326620.1 hypothetical protein [Oscillochloris sp. ZM17-4]